MSQVRRMHRFLVSTLAAFVVATVFTSSLAQDRQGSSTGHAITSKTTGIKLAWIPAGAFGMGSLSSEEGHTRGEDQHTVRITRPFYIGVTEVTQADYEGLMRVNPSAFCRSGSASALVSGMETSRFPVENVSWYDAIEFCNTLSAKDGLNAYYSMTGIQKEDGVIKSANVAIVGGTGYRLPTEAEWEYACRAGTSTAYHSGDAPSLLDRAGWFGSDKNQAGNSDKAPHRTGQKGANTFGLFDMHGNVSEWCQDWSDYNYYERSPMTDPTGPTGGSSRVVRGGSWNDDALNCRSAFRAAGMPHRRTFEVGFRIARTHVDKANPQKKAGSPPFRIVVNLRDGGAIDVYRNETFDTIDAAKQRLADSKFYGRTGNIQIIDTNGNLVE